MSGIFILISLFGNRIATHGEGAGWDQDEFYSYAVCD